MSPFPIGLFLRFLCGQTLLGITAALAFGYLGGLHLAFDAFSHFRLHLAVLLVLMAPLLLAMRWRPEATIAVLLGTAVLAGTFWQTGAPSMARTRTGPAAGLDGPVFRLLHMNLRYDNREPERALSLIGALQPDAITLNEVSPMWRARLADIEAAYPHRLSCPPHVAVGGVAILSRRPFAEGEEGICGDRGSFASVKIDFAGRVATVATVHMGWPWPFAQGWQLPRLEVLAGRLEGPVVLAGDLNATPWSQAARRLARAGGLRIVGGVRPTWLFRSMPDWLRRYAGLPIDHAMVGGGVTVAGIRTTQASGSDHLPLLLEFRLPPNPGPRPAPVLQSGARLAYMVE